MAIDKYFDYELKPIGLSKEETENPMMALHQFFENEHNIPRVRSDYKKLQSLLVIGNFNHESRKERSDMIFFCAQLEKMIEGAFLLYGAYKASQQKA